MKTILARLAFFSVIFLFSSCLKEYSLENNLYSDGALVSDLSNNCSTDSVGGAYHISKKINDSNFLQVQVNVAQTGKYNIYTDTVDGFSFKSSGYFNSKGTTFVKLSGSGTPVAAGNQIFVVHYNSSFCTAAVNVMDTLHPAIFSFFGAPDACENDSISGSYVQGILLDSSSSLTITLNVKFAGTYNISTITVNGYNFSGAGVIADVGLQKVTLFAHGTPVNAGVDVFTIEGSQSKCSFSNTVYIPVTASNNLDHFPLTDNSSWNYDDFVHAGDTVHRTIIPGPAFQNGISYKLMQETPEESSVDSYYYRKVDTNYYEYAPIDKYTRAVKFSPEVYDEINFLKENLKSGDSWYSKQFVGNATFGQLILLQYYFRCVNANATIVYNGQAFTNVYEIVMTPEIAAVGYNPGPTQETYTYYYARGIGLIYTDFNNSYYLQPILQIRNWIVN